MRLLIATVVAVVLALAGCGGGGQSAEVLGAPPPPAPPPPAPPVDPVDPVPPVNYVAIVGGITLVGGGGGQAPHAVHVRANVDAGGTTWVDGATYAVGARVESSDGGTVYRCTSAHAATAPTQPGVGDAWRDRWAVYSTTGSGFWPEGRWQVQFRKADGTALDSSDREWMRVTDPISGEQVYTDDRFSAAPTAAFLFRSPGSYRVRLRYQNRDKDWSDWVESATIVVTQNVRTKLYVDGSSGSDANDGRSATIAGGHGPKASLRGALALVNGPDFEIEVADGTQCELAESTNLGAFSGIWIHRSAKGSARPVVVLKSDLPLYLGDNAVVEGLNFAYDGSARYSILTIDNNRANVTVADCEWNECVSFMEIASDRYPRGLFLLRLAQRARAERYGLFINAVTCLDILGCDFTGGSLYEHTVRIVGNSPYVSIEASTLDYQGGPGRNKTSLRAHTRHLGVYRSVLARGTVGLGNIDFDTASYRDYCFDGCVIRFDSSPPSIIQAITIFENAGRVVFRTSLIEKDMEVQSGLISIQDNADGGASAFSGLRLYNVSIRNTGTGNNSGVLGQLGHSRQATDVVVRGIMMHHAASDGWSWGSRFDLCSRNHPERTPVEGIAGAWLFEDNVHSLVVPAEFNTAAGGLGLASAEAESWAENLIEEDHVFGPEGEPLGDGSAWRTVVRRTTGVFRSLNGLDWGAAGPAGCWLPPP